MRRVRAAIGMDMKMSQIVWIFHGLLILLSLGIIIYLNTFAMSNIREQETRRETQNFQNFAETWDTMLENNAIFVDNFIVNSSGMAKLGIAKTHEEQVYALQELKSALSEFSLLKYGMYEVFFYSESLGEAGFLTAHKDYLSLTNETSKNRARKFLEEYKTLGANRQWFFAEIDGYQYLVYISQRGLNYAGCWAFADELLQTALNHQSDQRHFLMADSLGNCRNNGYLPGETIDLSAAAWVDPDSGKVLQQFCQESSAAELWFVEHMEPSEKEGSVIRVRNIMVLLTILFAVMLLLFSLLLERLLYRPIRNLVVSMEGVSEGNFDSYLTDDVRLRETSVLKQTYNRMVDEIKHLKLAVYEEQLRKQKIRLQYLQLQIRPHFLVNALNSVCIMIDMDAADNARTMCLYLVRYFRYLYSQEADMVLLTEELEHVKTYLRIQNMRRSGKLRWNIESDEEAGLCLVPPLMLQTFIENSVKYGAREDSPYSSLSIGVKRMEGQVDITISDEGPGFPDEVLESLRRNEPIHSGERECIGIKNVLERLRLFYDGQLRFEVENRGGAHIHIRLPATFYTGTLNGQTPEMKGKKRDG